MLDDVEPGSFHCAVSSSIHRRPYNDEPSCVRRMLSVHIDLNPTSTPSNYTASTKPNPEHHSLHPTPDHKSKPEMLNPANCEQHAPPKAKLQPCHQP